MSLLSFGGTDQFGGALALNSGLSYDVQRTAAAVPTNALQSSDPIGAGAAGEWGGFFQNLLSGVVNYGISKDLAETQADGQVRSAQVAAQAAALQRAPTSSNLLLFGLVGVVAVVLILKA